MSGFNDKKMRLMKEQIKRQKRKKIVLSSLFGFIVLLVVGTILSTQESIPVFDNKYSIGKSMDYERKIIEMTDVPSIIENGKVTLSLADVQKHSIVYSMYDSSYNIGNGQKGLPLMAYITPAGRLTVATSFCEPCYSRQFRIEGDVLVCNTCSTRWALADLSGLSGGCIDYPPQDLEYTVNEATGQIVIDETYLKEWSPRDYDISTTEGMNIITQ